MVQKSKSWYFIVDGIGAQFISIRPSGVLELAHTGSHGELLNIKKF